MPGIRHANDMDMYFDKTNTKEPLTYERLLDMPYGQVLAYVLHHDKVLRTMAKLMIEMNEKIAKLERGGVSTSAPFDGDTSLDDAPAWETQHAKMETAPTKKKTTRKQTNIDDYEAAMAYKEAYDTAKMSVAAISKQINVPATTIRKYWSMTVEEASQLPKLSTMGDAPGATQSEQDYLGDNDDDTEE